MSFKEYTETLYKFDVESCNYTALVRDKRGVLSVRHSIDCHSMKEYAQELRGNGFRVLKIFKGYVSDVEVSDWQYYNRK